jgi:hypothetical protein
MRRNVLALVLTGLLGLTLLCGGALLRGWASDGLDLVLPGATNVQISGRGTAHLYVTYDLPANVRLNNLSQHIEQRGWRKITIQNYDRPGPAFARITRISGLGTIREVVVIAARPARRQTAEISVARCILIADWVTCL